LRGDLKGAGASGLGTWSTTALWLQIGLPFFIPALSSCSKFSNISCGARTTSKKKMKRKTRKQQPQKKEKRGGFNCQSQINLS